MGVLTEIGESVHRAGCDKLVLLNSHGGNVALLDDVAHELRARLHMFVVMASWHRFGYPEGSSRRRNRPWHSRRRHRDSLMLSFRPELVRLDAADNFASKGAALEAISPGCEPAGTGFGWMTQDL